MGAIRATGPEDVGARPYRPLSIPRFPGHRRGRSETNSLGGGLGQDADYRVRNDVRLLSVDGNSTKTDSYSGSAG